MTVKDMKTALITLDEKARQLQRVVASLEGISSMTSEQDRNLSRAVKELQHNLLQAICLEVNGIPTVLGDEEPPTFLVVHVTFYVCQKLRDMGLVPTLVTLARKLDQHPVDHSTGAALMSIISYIFDPYQKLCEGCNDLEQGKKMELRPKDLLVTAVNENFLELAFALWKKDGQPPRGLFSAEPGDRRPGSLTFLDGLATCDEVKLPMQNALCRSLLKPRVREAIRECLLTKNFDVLRVVFSVMKRALAITAYTPFCDSEQVPQAPLKHPALFSQWPRVMAEFVKEEWMRVWVVTMGFLKDEVARGTINPHAEPHNPPGNQQKAFRLCMCVLQIFNAATNNHGGAFGFGDASYGGIPYDPTPWPPALIKAHATLALCVLSESPSLFMYVLPCMRPYAHSPVALQTDPELLPGSDFCLYAKEMEPGEFAILPTVDWLKVFLCACRHSQEKQQRLLRSQLTFPHPDFTGNLHSHSPPRPLFRVAQFILLWAEALSLGQRSTDFDGVQADRWQNWDMHLDPPPPPELIRKQTERMQDQWRWQEPGNEVPTFSPQIVLQVCAQLIGLLAFAVPSRDIETNVLFIRIMESREKSCVWLRSQPAIKPVIKDAEGLLPRVKAACSEDKVKLPPYLSSSEQPSSVATGEGHSRGPNSSAPSNKMRRLMFVYPQGVRLPTASRVCEALEHFCPNLQPSNVGYNTQKSIFTVDMDSEETAQAAFGSLQHTAFRLFPEMNLHDSEAVKLAILYADIWPPQIHPGPSPSLAAPEKLPKRCWSGGSVGWGAPPVSTSGGAATADPLESSRPVSAAADGAAKVAVSLSSRPETAGADGAAKAAAAQSRPVPEAVAGAAKVAAPSVSSWPPSAADGASKAATPSPGPPPVYVPPKQPGTSSSKGQLRRCLGCHKEGYGYKKCSVCTGRFCSVECQRAAWPEHKKVCKPPVRSLDELPPGGKACRCSRPGGPGGYYN